MPDDQGGYLILFDEAQRTEFLREVRSLDEGFSDALSNADWSVRQWEVCGLMFEAQRITHWALARRGRRVATGKVRVEFTEVTPAQLSLPEIERRVGARIRANIVRARSGVGGRVPPATWYEMKRAVGEVDARSLADLERLERLRDQSREVVVRPGSAIVALERDAVGLALDIFDQTGQLRRNTLRGWTAPQAGGLTSFLDGLGGVRTIEDQLLARDAAVFSGTERVRHTVVGAVFSAGPRKLEVFNVNRTAIETSLGVDLVYWNEAFNAWTLVQYKSMERGESGTGESATYRPDAAFTGELASMQAFRRTHPDTFSAADGSAAYRMAGDGFFFKLCSRVQLEVLSEALLPGMYLPREFMEALLIDPATEGPRGGRVLTFENTQRHISNTLFAELVRDGWVGTRGAPSSRIAEILRASLTAGRAVVLARSRPAGAPADPDETLAALDV
jgi:hypothetical protein